MDLQHFNLHINKHFHFQKFLQDKFNDLLLADTLRTVAMSMISIFIPIFLIEQGFAVKDVALLMLGFYIGSIFLHWLTLSVIEDLGVKNTMIVSYIANIVLYGFLFNYELMLTGLGHAYFLLIILILELMSQVFYWTSHHVYFMCSTNGEESGSKLGLLVAVPALVGIVSPFVGSLIITDYGFEGAFLVSGLMMIAASAALFFSSDIKARIRLRIGRIFDLGRMRKNILLYVDGIGYAGSSFYWPLLMFVQSVQIISMGFLYLFSNIAYAVISYMSGRVCDKTGIKRAGRIGAVGWGITIVIRSFVSSIAMMTIFQTLGGLFGGLYHTALDADFFKGGHEHIGNVIMNRELYMHAGRATLTIAFLILLLYFGVKTALAVTLIISGTATILVSRAIHSRNFYVESEDPAK